MFLFLQESLDILFFFLFSFVFNHSNPGLIFLSENVSSISLSLAYSFCDIFTIPDISHCLQSKELEADFYVGGILARQLHLDMSDQT